MTIEVIRNIPSVVYHSATGTYDEMTEDLLRTCILESCGIPITIRKFAKNTRKQKHTYFAEVDVQESLPHGIVIGGHRLLLKSEKIFDELPWQIIVYADNLSIKDEVVALTLVQAMINSCMLGQQYVELKKIRIKGDPKDSDFTIFGEAIGHIEHTLDTIEKASMTKRFRLDNAIVKLKPKQMMNSKSRSPRKHTDIVRNVIEETKIDKMKYKPSLREILSSTTSICENFSRGLDVSDDHRAMIDELSIFFGRSAIKLQKLLLLIDSGQYIGMNAHEIEADIQIRCDIADIMRERIKVIENRMSVLESQKKYAENQLTTIQRTMTLAIEDLDA